MPKAISQAAYTLLAFSPFSDKDNYFLREIPDFGYFSDVISDIFLMCAQPSSAFIRVLNMAATVHS